MQINFYFNGCYDAWRDYLFGNGQLFNHLTGYIQPQNKYNSQG